MHMNSFNNRIIDECVHRQKECVQGGNLVVHVCTHRSVDPWIDPLIPGFMSLLLSLSINL